MFDPFEESLLENAISSLPEPQTFYKVPQLRIFHGEPFEGDLYFALEGRSAQIQDKTREIFHFRLTPLAWIPEAEEHSFSHTVWYERYRTSGWIDSFQLSVDHTEEIVRFGPSGNLMIGEDHLRGLGIGSFVWRILIKWAKRKFPDYKVYKIELSTVDAGEDNLQRRNHFFQKHGFKPLYDDGEGKSGQFYCKKVFDLKESTFIPTWNQKNSIEMVASLLREREDFKNKNWLLSRSTQNWFDRYDKNLARKNDRILVLQKRFKMLSAISLTGLLCLVGWFILKSQ